MPESLPTSEDCAGDLRSENIWLEFLYLCFREYTALVVSSEGDSVI